MSVIFHRFAVWKCRQIGKRFAGVRTSVAMIDGDEIVVSIRYPEGAAFDPKPENVFLVAALKHSMMPDETHTIEDGEVFALFEFRVASVARAAAGTVEAACQAVRDGSTIYGDEVRLPRVDPSRFKVRGYPGPRILRRMAWLPEAPLAVLRAEEGRGEDEGEDALALPEIDEVPFRSW